MVARLEGDIQRRASGSRAGIIDGMDFRMGASDRLVISLSNDSAVGIHHNGTDHRVGGCIARALFRQFKG